ncbi:hypothetical protein AX16_000311 [Volvariella volvacea WC 439]|nr:hypothetical protein AX16_000311 [Volvariella volvacea WC 439]
MLRPSTFVVRQLPRLYSTASPKPSIKLVAELRKLTEVSITKAREALEASNNDINAALEWLEKDLAVSGAKKAAKVGGRAANEGLITTSVLSSGVSGNPGLGGGGVRAAMVELNCETDFVGRGDLFGKLAADIAHTAAFIAEPTGNGVEFNACSLDALKDAPLLSPTTPSAPPSTVGTAIRDLIAKVGENITLRRAVTITESPAQPSATLGLRLASYVHGSTASQGRIGALALLALRSQKLRELLATQEFVNDLTRLERSLARQIVGLETQSIRAQEGSPAETALYEQPFMMYGGDLANQPVKQVLEQWATQRGLIQPGEEGGLAVVDFEKWTVGEPLP